MWLSKLFHVRDIYGGILAQAINLGSFAVDLSEAVVSPKAPDEMQWMQARTPEHPVLYPIARIPQQLIHLHGTWWEPQDSLQPVEMQHAFPKNWR